jgi:hypothetical protein
LPMSRHRPLPALHRYQPSSARNPDETLTHLGIEAGPEMTGLWGLKQVAF